VAADVAGRVAVLVLLAACGPVSRLARPEGDGGWSAARREEEIARRTAAGPPEPDAAPAAGPLTLGAALRLARTRSPRLAEAARQLDVARERVREVRARLLPTTTGSGRYTWYTDPQTTRVSLPPGLVPGGAAPPAVTIREAEAGVVNGTLALPLDVWGEARHALRAAQAGYRGERARVWATTLDQQARAVRAYFALLEARRLRAVSEQRLALQRRQLADAESRFASGRLTKNELLVVQVAVGNTEHELVQRDLAIDDARWRLNEAVGLPVDAPTDVVDVTARPAVPAPEEALRLAHAHNPALVALLEERQRLDDLATALARGRFPRLSAGAAVDWTSSDIVQPQRLGSGFVGFTWDLGTDGRREAEIAAARREAERSGFALERELRELEAAVRATQRATAERLGALAVAEAAVGQAEENLRIRRQQFDAGRATSEDVLDAEALLTAQRATLATALYEAHTRRTELQQLIGLPLEDGLPAQE
jgi:outer membrane protein TolC